MKIELKMNGKNFFDPSFIFFYNEDKTEFSLGIRYIEDYDYNFIREDLINNFENFEIKGNTFIYSTKENIYIFDLKEEFQIIPLNTKFKHGIVLLDKNDKILDMPYLKTTIKINENNNNDYKLTYESKLIEIYENEIANPNKSLFYNKNTDSKNIPIKLLISKLESNKILSYPHDFLSLEEDGSKIKNEIVINLIDNVNHEHLSDDFEHYNFSTGELNQITFSLIILKT